MPWMAPTAALAVSSILGADAASSAASTQAAASDRATQLQKEEFDKNVELQQPFRDAGIAAQNKQLSLLGLGTDTSSPDFGKYSKDPTLTDLQMDPGYAFRMSEGLKALDASAAARGGLLSGNTLRGVTDYGQNAASQEYQDAFNRYQVNRNNQLNPLQSLAGQGQTATNALTNLGSNYATAAGNDITNSAAAHASGYVGAANALTNGVGTGLKYNSSNNLANALTQNGGYNSMVGQSPSYQGNFDLGNFS